jgi:hypothetical protein
VKIYFQGIISSLGVLQVILTTAMDMDTDTDMDSTATIPNIGGRDRQSVLSK